MRALVREDRAHCLRSVFLDARVYLNAALFADISRADSAPVTYAPLPGATIGTAYMGDECRIEIDPSVKEDGPEAVCTVLAHERAHLRGREHGGSGLMRAKLPSGYVAPQCRSATADAEEDTVFFRPRSDGDGNGDVIPVPSVR